MLALTMQGISVLQPAYVTELDEMKLGMLRVAAKTENIASKGR